MGRRVRGGQVFSVNSSRFSYHINAILHNHAAKVQNIIGLFLRPLPQNPNPYLPSIPPVRYEIPATGAQIRASLKIKHTQKPPISCNFYSKPAHFYKFLTTFCAFLPYPF
jgi:hypothetical protein